MVGVHFRRITLGDMHSSVLIVVYFHARAHMCRKKWCRVHFLEQLKGEWTECLFCFDFVSDIDAAKIRNNSINSYQNRVKK